MKITFWGAAQTTTGSFHLLENRGRKLALDCGLFQGRRSEFYERNRAFPCAPAEVEALVLSHAHVDHCGNIPNFVKQGFQGPVYCTGPTAELARALILDSAFIQQKDVEFVNKKRAKKHEEPVEPLYTVEDAQEALQQFVGIGYYRPFCFGKTFCGKFLEAGHILGSAQVELDIEIAPEQNHRLVFSGDIGRAKNAILRTAEIPSDVETLIMESTYGDRMTEDADHLREPLRELVQRVADRGGKIIIPAFSVGRTQEVVYQLNQLFNANALPRIPIFVDSPLSVNVTDVFRKHPECFNRETREVLLKDPDIFGFRTLRYIQTVEESMALNDFVGPCVIISASGMCEAGRVLHHLRNSIGDKRNCVLIVGYQAEQTLGRRLVEKHERVRIFGEEHVVRCEVKVINGFSAHANRDELRDYAFRVAERSGGALRRVFLVHGEPTAQEALASWIRETLKVECHIPARADVFEI